MALGTRKFEEYEPYLRVNEGLYTALPIHTTGNLTVGGDLALTGDITLDDATITDDLTVTGDLNVTTNLAVSGTTLLEATNFKRQVTDTGGVYATPVVLTAAQSGRVILLDDAAGLDFTLPAIATAQIGTHFTFIVVTEVTSNAYRFTAQTGDILYGHVTMFDKDTATGDANALISLFRPDGNDLIVTIAGADDTTGSLVGGWLEFTAFSATGWFVRGSLIGDGSLATVFS